MPPGPRCVFWIMCDGLIVAAVEPVVEPLGLDDQRVALPAAAAVAQPLAHAVGHMRAVVERNDARLVDHLQQQHHVVRRLEDLVVRVVDVRNHGDGQRAGDAALPRVAIEPRIGLAASLARVLAVDQPPLRRRQQRRDATVGRVDDQRLAVGLGDLLDPPGAGPARRLDDRRLGQLAALDLRAGAPLERRLVRVVPDSAKVRSAPGRPGYGPALDGVQQSADADRRAGPRVARILSGGRRQREGGDQDNDGSNCSNAHGTSSSSHPPLSCGGVRYRPARSSMRAPASIPVSE